MDIQVVDDARRLATKVQQQQRELRAQREHIQALESRLRWYRQMLGVKSRGDSADEHRVDTEQPFGSSVDGFDPDLFALALKQSPGSNTLDPECVSDSGKLDEMSEVPCEDRGDGSSELEETAPEPSGVANLLRRWFS